MALSRGSAGSRLNTSRSTAPAGTGRGSSEDSSTTLTSRRSSPARRNTSRLFLRLALLVGQPHPFCGGPWGVLRAVCLVRASTAVAPTGVDDQVDITYFMPGRVGETAEARGALDDVRSGRVIVDRADTVQDLGEECFCLPPGDRVPDAGLGQRLAFGIRQVPQHE
jgi:hypothetical protein